MSDRQRQLHYLNAMGIPVWERRPLWRDTGDGHAQIAPDPVPETDHGPADVRPATPEPAAVVEPEPRDHWLRLRETVSVCTRCALSQGRTQTVFGVGSEHARLMIVGEAPGAEEDRRGEPFVGRAGKLLDRMLDAIALDREQVFIANILKCRPSRNRDPQAAEVEACMPYLWEQMHLLRPRVILCVGKVAANNLLQLDRPLRDLRASEHSLRVDEDSVPVIVSYHPAYLLRNPADKGKAWHDLKRVRALLREMAA